MKKSDLVNKIANNMLRRQALAMTSGNYWEYMAELAVNIAEEEGMKPPVTKNCPVLLTTQHTWEKEDA